MRSKINEVIISGISGLATGLFAILLLFSWPVVRSHVGFPETITSLQAAIGLLISGSILLTNLVLYREKKPKR